MVFSQDYKIHLLRLPSSSAPSSAQKSSIASTVMPLLHAVVMGWLLGAIFLNYEYSPYVRYNLLTFQFTPFTYCILQYGYV